MKKQICCACLAVLILLLAGCADSIPQRNYVGMTRGEVAAVLEKEAFRSRRSGNRFRIDAILKHSEAHHLRTAQDVLASKTLMKCPRWKCDFYPERHWLLGWSGLFARWHFQMLDFENDKVVRQTHLRNYYWVYGDAGESPYPQHPKNFHKVNDEIYRSGQPDEDEMYSMSTFECIKSVLNLREHHSDKDMIGKRKAKIYKMTDNNDVVLDREVNILKIKLYEIPLEAGKITEADLVTILRTVKNAPKPILIHCRHGSDRTGAVVAACRIVFENWSVERAVAELEDPKFGHHAALYKNIPQLIRKTDWETIRIKIMKDKQKPGKSRQENVR